ncbi:hypothetical protein Leryth_002703 [Lithospermum erythrorhizon]|nr:hypothetical protein Leryth_002703 [Lithospermum erythrorhizon]
MTSEEPGTSSNQINEDLTSLVLSDEYYCNNGLRNISLQTGEEFSHEFLRERVMPRKIPSADDVNRSQQKRIANNVMQNPHLVYEDLTGLLGISRKDSESSGTEAVDFVSAQGNANEIESKSHNNIDTRHEYWECSTGMDQVNRFSEESLIDRVPQSPSTPLVDAYESPQSLHHPYMGSGISTDSFSGGKIKFLCSFGGKILPRPNDLKLRYAGGETRIISIRKNVTFSELSKKTGAIWNQPHIIKYQLPGEDLDALISVSSDEDLHHMLEEYHDLERTSQRLRIFLISSNDSDSPCSVEGRTNQQNNVDYNYVSAVNNMMGTSSVKSSSRESQASQASHVGDSPLQPFDNHNGGSVSNAKSKFLNPTFQFVNKPHAFTKSYIPSPPMSPATMHHKDPKSSYFKEFEYPTFQGDYDFNNTFTLHQPVYDDPFNVDFYNYHPNDGGPTTNYKRSGYVGDNQPLNLLSHVGDTQKHYLSCSPKYDQERINPRWDLFKESPRCSESSFFAKDKFDQEYDIHKMPHAHSESKLQNVDRIRLSLEEELNSQLPFEDEKSPTLAMSSSCQEMKMQERDRSYDEVFEIHRPPISGSGNMNEELSAVKAGQIGLMETNDNFLKQKSDYKLSTDELEAFINYEMEDILGTTSQQGSFGLQPDRCPKMEDQEPKTPFEDYSVKEFSSTNSTDLDKNVFPKENILDFSIDFPIEPVIVEDVTDKISCTSLHSSDDVPFVQDESRRQSSDAEIDKGVSIDDATILEMEAGIYGLQIIKNVDLEEQQELGSGTFGTVYHGKWRGTDVAIKRIKKSCFAGRASEQERLTKDFWREAQILSKLHHPNVVAFYGVVPDGPGGTLATVTEYMVNGSLRHALVKKDRMLDRRRKLMIALDAAFGMEYLHLKDIVHFDLKCDNLLVNLGDPQRPVCKVGDFGLSRIKRNTLVSGGVRGTLPWMAPELLNGSSSRVSEKVDVFSFGIVMWEILTGEEPYASMHCGAIIGGIVNNTLRPPIPERCDSEWKKLMEECWSPDPSIRPSFTEITNRLRVMSNALQPKRFNRVIRR